MEKQLKELFRLQFWCQEVEAGSILALSAIRTIPKL